MAAEEPTEEELRELERELAREAPKEEEERKEKFFQPTKAEKRTKLTEVEEFFNFPYDYNEYTLILKQLEPAGPKYGKYPYESPTPGKTFPIANVGQEMKIRKLYREDNKFWEEGGPPVYGKHRTKTEKLRKVTYEEETQKEIRKQIRKEFRKQVEKQRRKVTHEVNRFKKPKNRIGQRITERVYNEMRPLFRVKVQKNGELQLQTGYGTPLGFENLKFSEYHIQSFYIFEKRPYMVSTINRLTDPDDMKIVTEYEILSRVNKVIDTLEGKEKISKDLVELGKQKDDKGNSYVIDKRKPKKPDRLRDQNQTKTKTTLGDFTIEVEKNVFPLPSHFPDRITITEPNGRSNSSPGVFNIVNGRLFEDYSSEITKGDLKETTEDDDLEVLPELFPIYD